MNQKEKLKIENEQLSRQRDTLLSVLGEEAVFQFIRNQLQIDIEDTEADLVSEQQFAKENPPGSTYGSAGNDARKRVKYLKNVKKQRQQMVKLFDNFIKQKAKVDKL